MSATRANICAVTRSCPADGRARPLGAEAKLHFLLLQHDSAPPSIVLVRVVLQREILPFRHERAISSPAGLSKEIAAEAKPEANRRTLFSRTVGIKFNVW